jgi:hypothetical protein
MDYYSARLLVVCLVDDGRSRKRNVCDYPFIVFRARDHAHAFRRALQLGQEQETTYENDKGRKVRWTFVRVEEITHLGRSVDGCEVGSLLGVFLSEDAIPFRRRFRPARHKPGRS